MGLFRAYFRDDVDELVERNVRMRIIGSRAPRRCRHPGHDRGWRAPHRRQHRLQRHLRLRLWRPGRDRRRRPRHGRRGGARRTRPGQDHAGVFRLAAADRAICRIPTWSSAPAASGGSAISSCGSRPMPSFCSSTRCGRISPAPSFWRRSRLSASASAASAPSSRKPSLERRPRHGRIGLVDGNMARAEVTGSSETEAGRPDSPVMELEWLLRLLLRPSAGRRGAGGDDRRRRLVRGLHRAGHHRRACANGIAWCATAPMAIMSLISGLAIAAALALLVLAGLARAGAGASRSGRGAAGPCGGGGAAMRRSPPPRARAPCGRASGRSISAFRGWRCSCCGPRPSTGCGWF